MKKLAKALIGIVVFLVLIVVMASACGGGGKSVDSTASAPAVTAPEPSPVEAPPADDSTPAQKNALRSAESYLSYTAFSQAGLIRQLKHEKFAEEDALWAVERVKVDWNEQAAKKAKSYLDFKGFSRDGLLKQLTFDGFTPEQAEHGVAAAGL